MARQLRLYNEKLNDMVTLEGESDAEIRESAVYTAFVEHGYNFNGSRDAN